MKLLRKAGATSEIWQIFIRDSSSTTGGALTGLTNASSGLTAYYHRDTDTTATAITLASMTVGTFTSSGFKEIDATNMPGWYQFCPPNAALASGAKSCAFHLKGATNMAPLPIEVQLSSLDPDTVALTAAQIATGVWQDTTAGDFTVASSIGKSLYTAGVAPGGSGGLLISGSNSGTTTFGAVTCTGAFTVTGATVHTGNVSMAAGLTITQSSSNTAGVSITGNGSGDSVKLIAGSTGAALELVGGSSSGDALKATTTSGHGFNITATGASKHGVIITGGDSGTSDGLKVVAGTGGVGVRLDTMTISGAVNLSSTLTISGATSLAALSMTTLTASGAVAFQSTFTVTTSTSLAALSCTTLTASGAVAFQSTWTVTGAFACNAGVTFTSSTSHGFTTSATGANKSGWYAEGNGSGNGAYLEAGATGAGLYADGGAGGYGMWLNGGVAAEYYTNGAASMAFVDTTGCISINATGVHGIYIGGSSGFDGINIQGGTRGLNILGSSGNILSANGVGTNQPALTLSTLGTSTAAGLKIAGGSTGPGILATGGSTSGSGIKVTTTNGHGLDIDATGSSKHGVLINGGDSGTSDGVNITAGSGGVGVRIDTLTTSGTVTFNAFTCSNNFTISGNWLTTGTTTWTGAATFTAGLTSNITGTLSTVTTLTNLPAITANWLTAAGIATDADAEIAAAVWDLTTSGHTASGTFGAAVVAAGSAGDPWSTSLPGSYGAGTAGLSLGAGLNALVTLIKAKTDNLPASPAAVGSAMTLAAAAITTTAIADGAITDAKITVPTAGAGLATGILGMIQQIWRRFFKKSTLTSSQLKTYADNGTTVYTTQAVSDDLTTQTQGPGT